LKLLIKLFIMSPVRLLVELQSDQKTSNQSIFWFFHRTRF